MADDQMVRDLARKCSDDVSGAMYRTMSLLDSRKEMAAVAFSGASSAMAVASGAFYGLREDDGVTPEAYADAIWETIRPMCVRSLARVIAEGQK